jgi:hypothetical protein
MKTALSMVGLFIGSMWQSGQPYPPPEDLKCPEGLQRVMVEPPNDQYKFLHDAAIASHKGMLIAGWYSCPEGEIVGESLIRARRSRDGGKTWSAPEVIASDREKQGIFYVPVNFLSHKGTLYAFVGIMKGHDRIESTRAYVLDETHDQWVSKGDIANLFLDNTAPTRMANGNFIMAGRMAAEPGRKPLSPAVAISKGDDLLGRWKVIPIREPEGAVGGCPETTLLVRNNALTALVRRNGSLVPGLFHSRDFGGSWSEEQEHQFRAGPVKMYSGTLSTGQIYVLFSYPLQSGNKFSRRLLVLGVSRPGEDRLARLWKIREGSPDGPSSAHYPCAIEHEGKLLVVYTADFPSRRACELAIIPVASLKADAVGGSVRHHGIQPSPLRPTREGVPPRLGCRWKLLGCGFAALDR